MRPINFEFGRYLVYGLVDPRTDDVRYIGKSASGLHKGVKSNDR